MTYYFGFTPTDDLSKMIDRAQEMMDSNSDEPYYPLRNDISHQIGRELIDNLLVNLIKVIPNPERQAKMTSMVSTIESATNTMLNILLGKDKNKEVIPNFKYLENETVFTDNEGERRVGFALSETSYNKIIAGLDSVEDDRFDLTKIATSLDEMNKTVVDHFITRFSSTLPLGMIKRRAVPIGKSAINKGADVALHKLLPQLDSKGINRLVNFYRPFIVEIN